METADTAKADPAAERQALREEYEKVIGKPPFNGWNADELRARITVARKAAALQSEGPGPRTGEDRVKIVITQDGVHVPLEIWDEDNKLGVAPDEWRNVPGPLDSIEGMSDNEKMELANRLDPKRIPKRARLDVPRSLAEFLSKRDQCEILEAA